MDFVVTISDIIYVVTLGLALILIPMGILYDKYNLYRHKKKEKEEDTKQG